MKFLASLLYFLFHFVSVICLKTTAMRDYKSMTLTGNLIGEIVRQPGPGGTGNEEGKKKIESDQLSKNNIVEKFH